uniref:Uncharacterized protein LOC114334577 n=1 Tax=Diabrotica virgifera virgifera TaxID=50390 RepID=A0A6P7FVC2_DIAVI
MSYVIKEVLKKVEVTKANHQKQLKILKQQYDRGSVEHFFVHIRNFLKLIFTADMSVYVENVLEFLALFIAEVTPDDTMEDDFTETGHPLLTMTIKETLQYHRLVNENHRRNSCLFIRLILAKIGPNKNLDNEICDLIEEAMLERTLDPKPAVRYQAVLALIRLQDPMNADSPVNKAYLSLIVDANASIRVEVVKNIAPYNISIPQIVNRLRDIDQNVRIAAIRKCADLSPKSFKILERQHILTCGITENIPKVKNVFIENLLPKWLNAYQNNYILFLNALKLDADENDISNTEKLTKDLFELWLRSTPVGEIISVLPLDEETKIIPLNKLTSEAVAVWYNLVTYLRDNGSQEEYLDDILPDLTPFCNYVESIINEKSKHKMEDWEYLDYQYILNSLFGIAAGYDFADEVGRKTLHQLSQKLLAEENLLLKLKQKLVTLTEQTAQKTEDITNIICHVISDIQAPLIEVQVEQSSVEQTNKEHQKAEIKIKIMRLETELEDAAENQEYLKAETLKNSISDLKRQLQELATSTIEMVKVTKDDHKTVCECLDLLISLLALPNVKTMTPSLVAVKQEFVIPLLSRDDIDDEVNWRLLKCIAMFCILDESMAQEYVKKLCIPIITYRQIPNYNKQALIISIKAIIDIFRIYGYNIFGDKDSTMVSTNGSRSNLSLATSYNKRRLYGTDQADDSIILVHNWETIVEVILNMLDDEISEIRNVAIEAISKLILNEFPVSPTLISRLILKWYNPMAAQVPDRSQQLIGVVISNYVKNIEGAKEVIANAIIPTLQSIVSAPTTSPLAAVDVDNLLMFLSTIIGADNRKDLINIHINMAHMFTHEIIKRKHDFVAIHLSKFLLILDISSDNIAAIKELKTQVQKVLDDESLSEKTLKRNLLKIHEKLNASLEKLNSLAENNLEATENSNINNSNEDNTQNEACHPTTSSDIQQLSNVTNSTRHITNLSSIQEENEDGQGKEAFENDTSNADNVDKRKSTDDEEAVEPDKNLTNNTAGSGIERDKENAEEQNSESSNDRNKNSEEDDENHFITPKKTLQEKRKRTKDVIEETNSDMDNNNKFSKRRKKDRNEGNIHSGTGDKGTSDLSEDVQHHSDKSSNQEIVVNITPRSRISSHILQMRPNLRNNKSPIFIQSSSSNEDNSEINKPRKRNASQKASKTNVGASSGKHNTEVFVNITPSSRISRIGQKSTNSSLTDKKMDEVNSKQSKNMHKGNINNNPSPKANSDIICNIDSSSSTSIGTGSFRSKGNNNNANDGSSNSDISTSGTATRSTRNNNTSNNLKTPSIRKTTIVSNEKNKKKNDDNNTDSSSTTSNTFKSTRSLKENLSSKDSNSEENTLSSNMTKSGRNKSINEESSRTENEGSAANGRFKNARNKGTTNNDTSSKLNKGNKTGTDDSSVIRNTKNKSYSTNVESDATTLAKNKGHKSNNTNLKTDTKSITNNSLTTPVRSTRRAGNDIDNAYSNAKSRSNTTTDSSSTVSSPTRNSKNNEKQSKNTNSKTDSKSITNNSLTTPVRNTRRMGNDIDNVNAKSRSSTTTDSSSTVSSPTRSSKNNEKQSKNTNSKTDSRSSTNNSLTTPIRSTRRKGNDIDNVNAKSRSSTTTDSSSTVSSPTRSSKNNEKQSKNTNSKTDSRSSTNNSLTTPIRSTRRKGNDIDNVNAKSRSSTTTDSSSTVSSPTRNSKNSEKQSKPVENKNMDKNKNKENVANNSSRTNNHLRSTKNTPSVRQTPGSGNNATNEKTRSKDDTKGVRSVSSSEPPHANMRSISKKQQKNNSITKTTTPNNVNNTITDNSSTSLSPTRSTRRQNNEKVANKYNEIMSQLISKKKNTNNSPKKPNNSRNADSSPKGSSKNLPKNQNKNHKKLSKELFPAKRTTRNGKTSDTVLDSDSDKTSSKPKIIPNVENNSLTIKTKNKSTTDTDSTTASSIVSRFKKRKLTNEKIVKKTKDLKHVKTDKGTVRNKRRYPSDGSSDRSSPKRLRIRNKRISIARHRQGTKYKNLK